MRRRPPFVVLAFTLLLIGTEFRDAVDFAPRASLVHAQQTLSTEVAVPLPNRDGSFKLAVPATSDGRQAAVPDGGADVRRLKKFATTS